MMEKAQYINESFNNADELFLHGRMATLRPSPMPSPRASPLRRLKNNLDFVLDVANNVDSSKKRPMSLEIGQLDVPKTLHQAARDGDIKLMKYLLDASVTNLKRKIDQLDEDELSPLHYAARYNFFEMVNLLVEKGANVNIRGEEGLTPLHFAARHVRKMKTSRPKTDKNPKPIMVQDPIQIVLENYQDGKLKPRSYNLSSVQKKVLFSKQIRHSDSRESLDSNNSSDPSTISVIHFLASQGAMINCKDNSGQTPLHYAAMRGNEIAARELLHCREINIEATDNQEMTPIHLAAVHGSVEIAAMLIEAGANIRCCDKNQATALHKAAMEGHIAIAKLLLDAAELKGGWVKVAQMVSDQDDAQNTALHLAVDNGHCDIVKLLIQKGADVNAPRLNFIYPLHLAAVSGNLDIVKLLVTENNARIDCLNRGQETPLYRAAEYNQTDVINYLILHGAMIERRDKDNFTPLLIAACEGHVDAIKCLLKHGADIFAVDKNDKSAVYWAAEENHLESLVILLQEPKAKELLARPDRFGNTPLHVAAMKGYLSVVQYLLDQDAQIDHKNEDEQTPLHFAAKHGKTKVVRELLKRKQPIVNDEDEDSNTAMHLAALAGFDRATQLLLNAGANSEERNSHHWTALDCACAKGWIKTVRVLLAADSPIDPPEKIKITPLHLAAGRGHAEVVKLLIQWGARVNRLDDNGRNSLEVAIEHSHKNVAMVIIQSDYWREALSNETINPKTGFRDTPMRMLIRKLPDVAEKVFFRCTSTNKFGTEHQAFTVTFNYEFLDDMYASYRENSFDYREPICVPCTPKEKDIYDDDNNVTKEATLYSDDAIILKKNHPLMIMVRSRRRKLLSHPLCMSLVHLKWIHFGRYLYYFHLLYYILFVTFITGYIIHTKNPVLEGFMDSNKEKIIQNGTDIAEIISQATCLKVLQESVGEPPKPPLFAVMGKYIIIVLSVISLIRETFQIYQMRWHYLNAENILQWVCYVSSLLLVIDFNECSEQTGYRESWQWQMASVTVLFSWVDLLLFIRKFPYLGIYAVMFTYVFRTFVKALTVMSLLLIAFGLAFYTIFHNQEQFETPWKSIIRVITMMLGEYQFDDLFDDDLAYPIPAYILIVLFLLLCSMATLNLLIGLAVDDIKEVQEQAELRRLAMQVELVLNVESILPKFLLRRFIIKQHSVTPNKKHDTFYKKILAKIAHFEMTHIAMTYSGKNDKTELEKIHENHEYLSDSINNLGNTVHQLELQNQRIESLLMTLISHKGLQWEDEDDYSLYSV
uniref:Ion transport domain-containing protein n=1 Tax=Strigamia maritima TaxID=126957 RepID=T1ILR7_STRMM